MLVRYLVIEACGLDILSIDSHTDRSTAITVAIDKAKNNGKDPAEALRELEAQGFTGDHEWRVTLSRVQMH